MLSKRVMGREARQAMHKAKASAKQSKAKHGVGQIIAKLTIKTAKLMLLEISEVGKVRYDSCA